MTDAERIRRAVEDGEYWGDTAPLLRDELVRVMAERDKLKAAWASRTAVVARWHQLAAEGSELRGAVECRADGSVRFFPED